MNLEMIRQINKLIDLSCSWRNSFYRIHPNNNRTPMIKYFDVRFDTRDMAAWLISLDTHEGQKSFRIDDQSEFDLLVQYLSIQQDDKVLDLYHDYPIVDSIEIHNYVFKHRKNIKNNNYFVTYSKKD